MAKYYYNFETGEVEEGKISTGFDRMGPYETREEAERALERARKRNLAADEAEREWDDDDWGVPPAPGYDDSP